MATVSVPGVGYIDSTTGKKKKPNVTVPSKQKMLTPQDYINQTAEALKQQKTKELATARDTALANLKTEQKALAPVYNEQRRQATAQYGQQSRNFAEYLAQRGLTNSGFSAQAELNRGSMLQSQVGQIGRAEALANQNILARQTQAKNQYTNDLNSTMFGIEQNKKNQLYNQYTAEQAAKAKEAAAQAAAQAAYEKEMRGYQQQQTLAQQKLEAAAKAAEDKRIADAQIAEANRIAAAQRAAAAAQAKIEAAKIKAQNDQKTAEAAALAKQKEAIAKANTPDAINKKILGSFAFEKDGAGNKIVNTKNLPGIGKIITESQMDLTDKYNMLKKYGVVGNNAKLGRINLKRFVEAAINSNKDERQIAAYLSKPGIGLIIPIDPKTGKYDFTQAKNVLDGLQPNGKPYKGKLK